MRYFIILLLAISTNSFAQCKDYIIGAKGDTLNCTDMKGRKQGPWVVKVESLRGERGYEEEGMYTNSMKTGIWRMYNLEGDLMAMENYRWGQRDGRNTYFNFAGQVLREEAWRAIDPKNPFDTINVYDVNDPTIIKGKQVIKVESLTVKHGTWKYYDAMTGRVERTEKWVMDKPKMETVVDDLAPIDVADGSASKAVKKPVVTKKPQAIADYEKKNSGKKKIRVRDGNTGG
ncbi:MAG: hypothetical protein WKF70_09315 [Chitinophagaceae bacterium]